MGSSTRKYSNIAKRILKEGNYNIEEGGKGIAYALQGVLKNGNSAPRRNLTKLGSSQSFKMATKQLYASLSSRKGELRGAAGKSYNIIIDDIVENCNFTKEHERVALKRVLRKVDFNEDVSVWKIIGDFFKSLLKTFFAEATLEPVSNELNEELDEDTVDKELEKIVDKVDYDIDKEDEGESITDKEIEEELVRFNNKVRLAFGGN